MSNNLIFVQDPKSATSSSPSNNSVKTDLINQLAKLMTACVILRVEDFTLFRVTTPNKKQAPKEFIKGKFEQSQHNKNHCTFCLDTFLG